MIRCCDDNRVRETDAPVDVLEELIQRLVEPQELIQDFLTVRPVPMPDRVRRGETNAEDIGRLMLAEMVLFHGFNRERQKHLVRERRVAQSRIVFGRRRRTCQRVWKHEIPIDFADLIVAARVLLVDLFVGKQPRPLPSNVRVGHALRVPLDQPLRSLRHVVRARYKTAVILKPVRGIAAMPGEQHGRAILE